MPPDLTLSFSDPGLAAAILDDPDFMSDGYRWGYDGHIWYCFINPRLWRYDLWHRWFAAGWIATILLPVLGQLLIAFNLYILPRHYSSSARKLKAPVVTSGPQMKQRSALIWFWVVATFVAPIALAVALIKVINTPSFPLLGYSIPFPSTTLAIGIVLGFNLACRVLYYMGFRVGPAGDVVGTTFVEAAKPRPGTYYLGRHPQDQGLSGYRIGPDRPQGLQPACGGLTALVVNSSPASSLENRPASMYNRLMKRRGRLVAWAIARWDIEERPELATAVSRNLARYGEFAPREGVLIVAGSKRWGHDDTLALLTHGTTQAVAVDSGRSAMLGRQKQLLIHPKLLRNPMLRYGFRVS